MEKNIEDKKYLYAPAIVWWKNERTDFEILKTGEVLNQKTGQVYKWNEVFGKILI